MTAKIYRVYDRRSAEAPLKNTLQLAIKGAYSTGMAIAWLFCFIQGFKFLFLASTILGTKLFEYWLLAEALTKELLNAS